MNWRRALLVLVLSVPLFVVLALAFGHDPHAVPSVLAGRSAPPCQLQTMDGGQLSLTQLAGKPLVINFWATWCTPCAAEHAVLEQTSRQLAASAQFLGVVYQDTPEAVQSYLGMHRSSYPHALDPGSRCAIDFGVAGVPETFFIDARGQIRHKHVGPLQSHSLAQAMDLILAEVQP